MSLQARPGRVSRLSSMQLIPCLVARSGPSLSAQAVNAHQSKASSRSEYFHLSAIHCNYARTTTETTRHSANTLLDVIEHVEHRSHPQHHSDANSADARVALASLLHEYAIESTDGELILSRDIFRSGRTVARINGRAFPQQVLQQVASWLIDIHGQSEHISLLRSEQHINFLDRYAETLPLREELAAKVNQWRNARKKLQSLQKNIREQERRAEVFAL